MNKANLCVCVCARARVQVKEFHIHCRCEIKNCTLHYDVRPQDCILNKGMRNISKIKFGGWG